MQYEPSSILNLFVIFISVATVTFLSGIQSKNINGGHEAAAIFTSTLLGMGGLLLYKTIPNAGWQESAAYVAGGPVGAFLSIRNHGRFVKGFHLLCVGVKLKGVILMRQKILIKISDDEDENQ